VRNLAIEVSSKKNSDPCQLACSPVSSKVEVEVITYRKRFMADLAVKFEVVTSSPPSPLNAFWGFYPLDKPAELTAQ